MAYEHANLPDEITRSFIKDCEMRKIGPNVFCDANSHILGGVAPTLM